MKHIKKYENNDNKLKKYIIWETINSFYIFNIIKEEDVNEFKRIYYKMLFSVDKNNTDKLIPIDDDGRIERYISKNMRDSIVFESDELETCINVISTLIISKKYNI
jgi:hypothetical protein